MRFLILFTVHNITHYQGDKGLFSDKKGLILVSGGSKAVFMALNFAGTGAKLLFEACTKIFRVRKSDHIRHFPYRIFPGNQQLFCLVQTDNADEVIRSLPGQRLYLIVDRSAAHAQHPAEVIDGEFRIGQLLLNHFHNLVQELLVQLAGIVCLFGLRIHRQHGFAQMLPILKNIPDTHFQHRQVERLDDVVIGTGLQSEDDIFPLTQCGQ